MIFLQETHSTKIFEKVCLNQWGCSTGNIIFSHGASDSRGVLIAFRKAWTLKSEHAYVIKMDITLSLVHMFKTIQFSLLITMHQMMKVLRFKLCQKYVTLLIKWSWNSNLTIVWEGEFNLVFASFLDADGGKPQLIMNSLTKLLSIMSERDLCDLYIVRHSDTRRFT